MKVSQRLDIIDRIGRELQTRFTYQEIDSYLAAFGIQPPTDVTVNSKWVYAKRALASADLQVLGRILDDLGMGNLPSVAAAMNPPANWVGTKDFRLFISHVSKDKLKAKRLKECLAAYAVSGFVAHEDIHPTLEWQGEIERALLTMDAFVAVHTEGFSKSHWTQQEVGFALGRGVKIISFRMGEDPTGFISKRQALSRQGRTAEAVAVEIASLLLSDPQTSTRLVEAQNASGLTHAEIPF